MAAVLPAPKGGGEEENKARGCSSRLLLLSPRLSRVIRNGETSYWNSVGGNKTLLVGEEGSRLRSAAKQNNSPSRDEANTAFITHSKTKRTAGRVPECVARSSIPERVARSSSAINYLQCTFHILALRYVHTFCRTSRGQCSSDRQGIGANGTVMTRWCKWDQKMMEETLILLAFVATTPRSISAS